MSESEPVQQATLDDESSIPVPFDGEPDPVCAEAVDLALAVAQEVAESADHVGAHVGVVATGPYSVVHLFTCAHPGYVGWVWSVALSRLADSSTPLVDEAWLEPGDGALLAPPWRPWTERVQPGDLGVGDVFPTAADDARLTAGFTGADDLDSVVADQPLHPLQWQLGLGRLRVLSTLGREDAAERWLAGEGGPLSPVAKAAAEQCVTCGWLMPIGGALGQAFGVCAQPMSPSDGRVVSMLHGCGAHSEVLAEPSTLPVVEIVLDDSAIESFELDAGDDEAETVTVDAPAEVDDADAGDEETTQARSDIDDEPILEQSAEEEPASEDTAGNQPADQDAAEPESNELAESAGESDER